MTSWAYLLVFNTATGTRKEVTDYLDTLTEVTHWYAIMPYAVFLTAGVSARYIAKGFREKFGSRKGMTFFITEVSADRDGWAPRSLWHMLKNPNNPRL
jgi:hypothetical protein